MPTRVVRPAVVLGLVLALSGCDAFVDLLKVLGIDLSSDLRLESIDASDSDSVTVAVRNFSSDPAVNVDLWIVLSGDADIDVNDEPVSTLLISVEGNLTISKTETLSSFDLTGIVTGPTTSARWWIRSTASRRTTSSTTRSRWGERCGCRAELWSLGLPKDWRSPT